MSEAKPLRNPGVNVAYDDRYHRLDGYVDLYAYAAWLKSEPMVAARLTVREARLLAEQLLVEARRADVCTPRGDTE